MGQKDKLNKFRLNFVSVYYDPQFYEAHIKHYNLIVSYKWFVIQEWVQDTSHSSRIINKIVLGHHLSLSGNILRHGLL
jgi:hypothetical protein